jgi:hypothetical protein
MMNPFRVLRFQLEGKVIHLPEPRAQLEESNILANVRFMGLEVGPVYDEVYELSLKVPEAAYQCSFLRYTSTLFTVAPDRTDSPLNPAKDARLIPSHVPWWRKSSTAREPLHDFKVVAVRVTTLD